MRTTEQKHIEAPLLSLLREGAPTYEESTSGRGVPMPYELCTCEGATHSECRGVRQRLREVSAHGSVGPACPQSPFSPQAPSPHIRDNKELGFPLQIFIAI